MPTNPIGLPTHYGAPMEFYKEEDERSVRDTYALTVYFTSAEHRKAFALAVRQAIKEHKHWSVGCMSRTGADLKPEPPQKLNVAKLALGRLYDRRNELNAEIEKIKRPHRAAATTIKKRQGRKQAMEEVAKVRTKLLLTNARIVSYEAEGVRCDWMVTRA